MSQSEQAIKRLKNSIKDFQSFNYNVKKTISQLRYDYEQQSNFKQDKICAGMQQEIKDKINALTNVATQVLRMQEHKLLVIIKHVDMAQIQINSKNKLEQEYERTIQQMQNEIGNLACKCTELEIQLNELKIKNASLLQQFSTLSQFSNKKILELQYQKRMHKKQSSLSLGLSTQFSLENLTKKSKQQIQISRKTSSPQYKINNPESRQTFKYKSPQKYNLISKYNDVCQNMEMTSTSKKIQKQLDFGCVPFKKILYQNESKATINKSDNKIHKKNDDMNRRLEFLLTTLSGKEKSTTNNSKQLMNDLQKKNRISTEPNIYKI